MVLAPHLGLGTYLRLPYPAVVCGCIGARVPHPTKVSRRFRSYPTTDHARIVGITNLNRR